MLEFFIDQDKANIEAKYNNKTFLQFKKQK